MNTVIPKATAAGRTRGRATLAARQEQLRADMRSEVVKTALTLFSQKGFDATTVDDIVAAVGISQRTFFRYFESKDDLPFVWVEDQGEFVRPALAKRPAEETPFEATCATLLALSDWHDSRRKDVGLLVRLIFGTPSLFGRYKREHDKWAEEMIHSLQESRGLSESETFAVRMQVLASISTYVASLQSWAKGNSKDLIRTHVEAGFLALISGVRK